MIGSDRTVSGSPFYCNDEKLNLQIQKNETSHHPYSPNTEWTKDKEASSYWLQFSDFYQWPHIQFFSNAEELHEKLKLSNFAGINRNMEIEYKVRRKSVLTEWCKVLPKLGNT